jgi:hypothetical protein
MLRRLSSNGGGTQQGRGRSSGGGIASSSSWWGRITAAAPPAPARSSAFAELAAPLLGSDDEDTEDGAEDRGPVQRQQQQQQQQQQRQAVRQQQQQERWHLGEQLLAGDPLPLSTRACWLLLQALLDCLLIYSWGLGPSGRFWPSFVLLAFVALPHLLVALVVHIELICSEGEGGGAAARWYYQRVLRAQKPWQGYALLLGTLVPLLLALTAAGPALLVLSLAGRGHLLPGRHHVRLLHTLVSLTEAPFQAVLVTVMFLLGNNASYQVGCRGCRCRCSMPAVHCVVELQLQPPALSMQPPSPPAGVHGPGAVPGGAGRVPDHHARVLVCAPSGLAGGQARRNGGGWGGRWGRWGRWGVSVLQLCNKLATHYKAASKAHSHHSHLSVGQAGPSAAASA